MRALPEGTVTFLFTDIERSTQTTVALGDERYADLQAAHRELLREAFDAGGGVEVGTEGDAFFVAFARAGDAVASAVAAQRAVETYAWPPDARIRVRMGLHTGEAAVRDGDYVGRDVNKAKRVSDAGHGGQVVLSEATARLVEDQGVSLADLGMHRLKDLGEPQRLFQVVGDGLQREFPPLRSLDAFRHNLPPQRTAFVGREAELARLRELLAAERLVTLTGVGGVGKTRLALQAAADVLARYDDGVFLVDLSLVADGDSIPGAIAEALGIVATPEVGGGVGGSSADRVLAHLARRQCLLVLDNCEHLLDSCAAAADELLTRCPGVTLLATSREALDVEGEQAWRVPSLTVPDGAAGAEASDAVELFATRARAVAPDFEIGPANGDAVAEICRRLDGIPLAIELAASRVSHMTPAEIEAHLGDMFQLLVGGRRRRAQRQQTLQAALDWSHDLLDDAERVVLRRLSVFSGTFSLDAVETVCDGDPVGPSGSLGLLASLVAKSLVSADQARGATRYRLMETVRLYALGKLREAGETDTYRDRHAAHYLEQALARPLVERGGSITEDGVALAADFANVVAALERLHDTGRADLVLRMASHLFMLWGGLGHEQAGLRWLTVADVEDVDMPEGERVATLAYLSFLSNYTGRPGGMDFAERAVRAAAGADSPEAALAKAHLAINLAIANQATGDAAHVATARRLVEEFAEHRRAHAELDLFPPAQLGIVVELILGDHAAAFTWYETGRPDDRAYVSFGAAVVVAHLAGRHDLAASLARIELAEFADGHARGYGRQLGSFGEHRAVHAAALAGAGHVAEGLAVAAQALADADPAAPRAVVAVTGAAVVLHLAGDHENASRLLSWVRATTIDRGRLVPHPMAWALYRRYTRPVRDALEPEVARRCRTEGTAMSVHDIARVVSAAAAAASAEPVA